mmetsp:Transcript_83544/g.167311  ORF Transcript_83544/g.167311 Transcript_83544/m.167311 type:complete len:208 (-) Transcript_83544:1231-1854(-)
MRVWSGRTRCCGRGSRRPNTRTLCSTLCRHRRRPRRRGRPLLHPGVAAVVAAETTACLRQWTQSCWPRRCGSSSRKSPNSGGTTAACRRRCCLEIACWRRRRWLTRTRLQASPANSTRRAPKPARPCLTSRAVSRKRKPTRCATSCGSSSALNSTWKKTATTATTATARVKARQSSLSGETRLDCHPNGKSRRVLRHRRHCQQRRRR